MGWDVHVIQYCMGYSTAWGAVLHVVQYCMWYSTACDTVLHGVQYCIASRQLLPLAEQLAVTHNTPTHQHTVLTSPHTLPTPTPGGPADCSMIALDPAKGLLPALGLTPLLAVSGPNYGYNISTDVLHSGTVAAARMAAMMGVPGLASSGTFADRADPLEVRAGGACVHVCGVVVWCVRVCGKLHQC
jgi:broad specificity polyphosphatase/5'/3'-nucleotidase SurE